MDKLKELKAIQARLESNATTPEEVEEAAKMKKEIEAIETSNKEWASKYAQAIRHTSGKSNPEEPTDEGENENPYKGAPLDDIQAFADWYLEKHPIKK